MKLLVLSDLHVEFAPFVPPPHDADVVVLAGDIHQGAESIYWARRTFRDLPIVQIAGNHEFFDGRLQSMLARMRRAAIDCEVFLLEQDEVVIGDVAFAGCTLWTDFRLLAGPGARPRLDARQAMALAARRMIDYALIEWQADAAEAPRRFTPADSVTVHESSRDWLLAALARPWSGRRVVVTHHLPSWGSVAPQFAQAPTNPAFASNLDHLFGRADLWIHGHTHTTQDWSAGGTRVVCNPRGYPQGKVFENPDFDPGLVIDLN